MGLGSSLGKLLGGGSSSVSAPSTVYGAQDPYLQDLYSRAQMQSYGGMGQDFAQQFMQPAAQGFQQLAGGGQQVDTSALQGIASGQTQNQALGGAIQAGLGDISRNFQQNIMPSINLGSAMTGTAGGSRQGIAQGLAAQGANRQASDFVNRMQSQNYQQGIQNQIGAAGQMGNIAQMQNQAQAQALGMAPQLQNLGFGAQYGNLAGLQSLIGAPTVLGGGGSSTQQGGIGSSLGGLADMGMAGFLMGGGTIASDRRIKENIKKVGKLDNGLQIYSYNYKGQTTTQIGVMAQEVEVVKPGAVVEIGGIKRVNYSLAVA